MPRTRILLTLGVAATLLAGCTSAPERASPGAGTLVTTGTAAPTTGAGPGEVAVTVFHETHTHAALGGGSIRTGGRHVVEAFNTAGLDADTVGYNELELPPPSSGSWWPGHGLRG